MGRSRVVTTVNDADGGVEGDVGGSSGQAADRQRSKLGGEQKPKRDQSRLGRSDNTFRKRNPAPRFGGPAAVEELPKRAFASDSEKMKKIFQMLRWHPLEPIHQGGVPYVINFFFHLWAMDEVFDRSLLGVHIPDTVIVQKGSPAYWFYTDEKSMRVMMKDEELIRDKQHVLSALTQRAGVSQQAGRNKGGRGVWGKRVVGAFVSHSHSHLTLDGVEFLVSRRSPRAALRVL